MLQLRMAITISSNIISMKQVPKKVQRNNQLIGIYLSG